MGALRARLPFTAPVCSQFVGRSEHTCDPKAQQSVDNSRMIRFVKSKTVQKSITVKYHRKVSQKSITEKLFVPGIDSRCLTSRYVSPSEQKPLMANFAAFDPFAEQTCMSTPGANGVDLM